MYRAILRTVVSTAVVGFSLAPLAADPVQTSTLGWMVNGIVSEVARAGDIAYVGGSFRTVSPSANLVFNQVTFSTTSAVAVLPRLDLNGRIRAVVALPGGGWIIGGEFTRVGSATRRRLARLLPDGTLDTTFDVVADGTVRALAVSGTTLYAGGGFANLGGQSRPGLAAIDLSGGAVVSAFAPAVTGGSVFDLLLDGTTLFAAGDFTTVDATARASLAALNTTTGALVTSFDADADGKVARVLKRGSHLFAAGDFSNIGGLARRGVAKLDASTGSAVPAFDGQMTSNVAALDASASTLYVGGTFSQAGGASRRNLAALDLTNGHATAWQADANDSVAAMALSGTTLIVAGSFEKVDDSERLYLAALDTTTDSVLSWNPALNNDADFLAVDTAGTVFVGGSFTGYGAVRRDNLAAIDLHNGELLSWNPGTNGWVRALDVHGNTVFLGGDFTSIAGVSRGHIAAVNGDTGRATSWRADTNGTVKGMMIVNDTVYFVGSFSSVSAGASTPRGRGAAVAVNGDLTSWNPAANDTIESLVVEGARVYLGGSFTMLGSSARNRLAAVDATTGAALANFSPSVDDTIYRVDVQDAVVYFGGRFQSVDGTTRANAAAVRGFSGNTSPTSPLLLPWNPGVGGPVYDLDAFGDDVYLAGGFGSVGGASRPGIAMVNADPSDATLASWRPADVSGGSISVIDTSADAVLFGGLLYDDNNISIGAVLFPEASLSGAPRPPTTPNVRLNGTAFAMSWARPPLGPPPASYVIEGGSGPGRRDLANFSTGSDGTSFTAAGLAPGTYYLRMRSANAHGLSVAGDELAFTVGASTCSAPPERPLDLAASVTGTTVTLDWRLAPESIVTGHLLRVGSRSESSDLVILPVGSGTSVTVDAPAGAFFVTLAAVNDCGVSAASPEEVIIVGNPVVPPTAPFELQSALAGRTLTLSWAAPSVGTGPFTYVIEAGSAPGQSNIAVVPVGSTSVVATVGPGIYYVRVRAVGPGGMGPGSNEVVVVVP
jgi:hypothetical protein